MELEVLIAKAAKFEVLMKALSRQRRSGSFGSVFKGRGLNFDSIRHYQPGDEFRNMNWKASARLGVPHVNNYLEDKQRVLWLVIDLSASVNFGPEAASLLDIQQELAISLIYSALQVNDSVGLIFFSDGVEKVVQPVKGMSGFMHLANVLASVRAVGKKTNLNLVGETVLTVLGPDCILVLLSDFFTDDYEPLLRVIAWKHHLILLKVKGHYTSLSNMGWVKLEGMEGGDRRWVDSRSEKFSKVFLRETERFDAYFDRVCSTNHFMSGIFSAGEDVALKLIGLMQGDYAEN